MAALVGAGEGGERVTHGAPVPGGRDLDHLLLKLPRQYWTSLSMSPGRAPPPLTEGGEGSWAVKPPPFKARTVQLTDKTEGQDSRASERLFVAFWKEKVGSFTLQLIIDMKWGIQVQGWPVHF